MSLSSKCEDFGYDAQVIEGFVDGLSVTRQNKFKLGKDLESELGLFLQVHSEIDTSTLNQYQILFFAMVMQNSPNDRDRTDMLVKLTNSKKRPQKRKQELEPELEEPPPPPPLAQASSLPLPEPKPEPKPEPEPLARASSLPEPEPELPPSEPKLLPPSKLLPPPKMLPPMASFYDGQLCTVSEDSNGKESPNMHKGHVVMWLGKRAVADRIPVPLDYSSYEDLVSRFSLREISKGVKVMRQVDPPRDGDMPRPPGVRPGGALGNSVAVLKYGEDYYKHVAPEEYFVVEVEYDESGPINMPCLCRVVVNTNNTVDVCYV